MTNQEIIDAGQTIHDEETVGANTSERVGGAIKGIGQNLAEKEGDIADLDRRLGNEATARQEGDGTLQVNLQREMVNRQEAVSAEATARQDADAALQDAIDDEEHDRIEADGNLQLAIGQEAIARQQAVNTEKGLREDADAALQDAIDDEEAARREADGTLQVNLGLETTNRQNADADEATARQNADAALQTAINNEVSARQSAVSGEATARQNADTALQDAIDDESAARQSAVSGEATARQNADAALQDAIDDEVAARQNADTALQNAINSETSARQSALSGEATSRQEAIAALAASVGYFVCDSSAATAAKTVAATGFVLATGGNIRIKMTNANSAANATLNINGTGAKALFYDGTQASSSNTWDAGDVLTVYYDGTQYQVQNSGGGKFSTGEKVKDTSVTDDIAEDGTALITNGGVYDATSMLRYTKVDDVTSNAVQQHIDTQYSVYFNSNGTLGAAGYATAYLISVSEGQKLQIYNAYNDLYQPRILYFYNGSLVTAFMKAALPDEPIVVTIPAGVDSVGINRKSRDGALVVNLLTTLNKIDGANIAAGTLSKTALGEDITADLMSSDSDKYKLLQAVSSDAFPIRETILQYKSSTYATSFPSTTSVWGAEKYESPIEIIGFRILSIGSQTANIFVYNTSTHAKVLEKDVALVAGENVVYFDTPHFLNANEIAGVTAAFAGQFDNNERQVGNYLLDLSTGVLTANKRNCCGFTVIYRSAGNAASTSILYAKNFEGASAGDEWVGSGTIVEGSDGITLANTSPIYLNRSYASNKTVRVIVTLHSDTVLKLGYKNMKTGVFSYVGTVDCANSKITIGNDESAFTVTDEKKYTIDLIKNEYIATLRVTDYKSGVSVVVKGWDYSQNDYPALCLGGGTTPTIEAYSLLSEMSEPYIMFFGDSITDGAQTPMYNGQFLARFGDMIGKKTGKPYLVSGRAGSTIIYITDEIYGRLFTEAKILRPKFAFVTIGTNGGNTEQNLTTLVKKMQDYGIKVILNNVPNRTYNGSEVDITETNTLLEQIRGTFGLDGVHNELACSVDNDGITTNTDMYGSAQAGYVIHPNGEGHYQMFLRTFIDCPEIYTEAGVYPVPDEVPSGTTADRPADAALGDIYYDSTLGYHVWSTGAGTWKDKNGVTV